MIRWFLLFVVFCLTLLLVVFGLGHANLVTAITTESEFWLPATNHLPHPMADPKALLLGNQLYVFGGKTADGQPVSSVYHAMIHLDGSIEQWKEDQALPKPLYIHAAAASNGKYVYVIGGYDGHDPQKDILRAQFKNNGRLGSWNVTEQLSEAITLHDAVVDGNFLYIVGGTRGPSYTPSDQIIVFRIEPTTGNLSDKRIFHLPKSLFRVKALVHHGYLYVIGGYDGEKRSKKIYFARLDQDGGIDPDFGINGWDLVRFPDDSARDYPQAVVHNGEFWVLGGRNANGEPESTIFTATFNDDGSLTWKNESSLALPRPLYRFGLVSAPFLDTDYLYLLGGLSSDSPTYRDEVYYSNPPLPIIASYFPLIIKKFYRPTPAVTVTMKGMVYEADANTPISNFTSVVLASSYQPNPTTLRTQIDDCQTDENGAFDCSVDIACQPFYFVSVNPEGTWANYMIKRIVPPADGKEVDISGQRWVRFERKNQCEDTTLEGTLFFIQKQGH